MLALVETALCPDMAVSHVTFESELGEHHCKKADNAEIVAASINDHFLFRKKCLQIGAGRSLTLCPCNPCEELQGAKPFDLFRGLWLS